MKLLAILGGAGNAEGAGVDKDPFAQGFRAFKKALAADDATRAREAFRLMVEACRSEEDDDEEGEDS